MLPSGIIARVLREVSSFALQRYDAVVSIGRCMTQRLVARGIPSEKIHLIPNWAPPIVPRDKFNNPFRRQQGLEGISWSPIPEIWGSRTILMPS